MKSRFLLFGIVLAAIVFLYKRLIDTEEKLVLAEAERNRLQREQDAIKESFMEANQHYEAYDAENPLPDDPDRKIRLAMLDAIRGADAREELGENHVDYTPYEDEEDDS